MENVAIEIVKFLAGEAASNALQRLLPSKSLEEKVEQALGNALDKVARGNEIWKEKVVIQKGDVIEALVWMADSPDFSEPSTNLFDKKLLIQFKTELEKDANTWAYLQILLLNYRLKKASARNEQEIRRLDDKINELKRNIDAKIHYLTSVPSWADSSTVIGREKDLDELWKMLSEKRNVMLSGLGGIGKTKVAQLLFHNYRDRFDEVAWIGYKGSLRQSFAYRIEDYQDRNDPWEVMMNDLHNDGKTKLFIIDNVDDDANQNPLSDKDLRNLTGWENTAILLTSRLKEDLRPYSRYELKALGKDDCIAVFNHYYGSEPDPECVGKIVALAHYHTFTIELLARGAKRENLAAYYKKIKKGFDEFEREVHSDYDNENATIERHLRCLFDIQKRPEANKKVLNGFAVLPVNCECSLEEIGQWFGFENKDLDELIQDGWLSYDESNQAFSMHPLVRTIVRFDFLEDERGKRTIAPEGTADKILDYFVNHEELFFIDIGTVSLQRMIEITELAISVVDQKETVQIATIYCEVGLGYKSLGEFNKALEYYKLAIAIRESELGEECPLTATTYNSLGSVYRDMSIYGKALEYYEKAKKIRESKLGKDHIDTAGTYNEMALTLYYMGKYDEALEYYKRSLTIREFKLGKDHPDTAETYHNMAKLNKAKGDYVEGLKYYEKALAIYESKLCKDHLNTATTYNSIAGLYKDMVNYVKALEYYEKAKEIRESKLGINHPETATTYNDMALIYYKLNNYVKASEYCQKAMEIDESKLGKFHPSTATVYNNIAWVYKANCDYGKALEHYLKALRIWLNRDVNHPNAKTILGNLICCYQEANMEKDLFEWLKEQLSENEWEAYLDLIPSLSSGMASQTPSGTASQTPCLHS